MAAEFLFATGKHSVKCFIVISCQPPRRLLQIEVHLVFAQFSSFVTAPKEVYMTPEVAEDCLGREIEWTVIKTKQNKKNAGR